LQSLSLPSQKRDWEGKNKASHPSTEKKGVNTTHIMCLQKAGVK